MYDLSSIADARDRKCLYELSRQESRRDRSESEEQEMESLSTLSTIQSVTHGASQRKTVRKTVRNPTPSLRADTYRKEVVRNGRGCLDVWFDGV